MAETIIAPPDKPVLLQKPAEAAAQAPEAAPKAAEAPPKSSFLEKLKTLPPKSDKAAPSATPPQNQQAAQAPAPDDDAPSEIRSAAGKTDWAKLKQARMDAEKRAAEFEAKFNTETATLKEQLAAKEKEIAAAKAAFDPDEVKRLREEHAALKNEINLADVTKSPEWRQHFVIPIENATKAALDLVPDESKPLAKWYLEQPDSPQRTQALEDLMNGMSMLKVGKFTNALTAIDSTRERANALLSENQQLVEKFQKGRETEAQLRTAKQKQEEQATFKAIQERVVAAKIPWASDPASYDKAAAESLAKAEAYFGAGDTETRARVAHWAAFGEAALPQIKSLMEQLAAERATIAKLTAAGTKSPSGTGTGNSAPVAPKGGEFLARVRGQI